MVTIEAELEAQGGAGGDGRPSPFTLLFAPDRGMERQARVGRVRWILIFAWVASLLLGVALAARVDASSSTLRRLEQGGQLQGMSDRQLADETKNAERVFEVTTVARGAVGAPVQLGLASLAIVVLVWFFRGRIKGSAVAPVAAATLLPEALANLLDAACAFRYESIPPEGSPLAPRTLSALMALAGRGLPDPWMKVGNALDFFSLWAAVMTGFGVAAVGKVPRGTAVLGTLVAWVCYRLLTQVAMGG